MGAQRPSKCAREQPGEEHGGFLEEAALKPTPAGLGLSVSRGLLCGSSVHFHMYWSHPPSSTPSCCQGATRPHRHCLGPLSPQPPPSSHMGLSFLFPKNLDHFPAVSSHLAGSFSSLRSPRGSQQPREAFASPTLTYAHLNAPSAPTSASHGGGSALVVGAVPGYFMRPGPRL